MHLPSDLINSLATGRILPVVGWGHPDLACTGPPVPARTPEITAAHLDEVERWLTVFSPSLTPLYQCIAELPVRYVVAITADRNLTKVLQSNDPQWTVLHPEQREEPGRRRILIPIGGLQDDPESLVLAERQYLAMDQTILWSRALGQATQVPLLILGCDPTDAILLNLLAQLRPRPPFELAGWLLSRRISPAHQIAWQHEGFVTIEGHPGAFLRELAATTRDCSRQASSEPVSTAGNPYKRLDYFERLDSEVFFGREEEIECLIELVCSHRLVVVTGPSGAGKTSLINAGLLAWTDRSTSEGGIYIRVGDDPVAALRDGISRYSGEQYQNNLPLKTILLKARDRHKKTLVIVLDQAEELFTRVGSALVEELASAMTDALVTTPLVARFVICLREDYLARLAELREWIPSALQSVFYLRELTRQNALAPVQRPAERRNINFEPGLPEQIVSELGLTVVAPPQIQIICSRLFEECHGNTISRALYESLGGAKALLRSFLMEELAKLPEDVDDVRNVLKAMVTAEGTKEPLTLDEVAKRAHLSKEICQRILTQLRDRSRLLRGIQIDRDMYFELAHEYLTIDICSWMTPEEIRCREAEGLLQREVHSWRRFKQLRLGLDRLKFFEANLRLIVFDVEPLVLLLLSCVRHHQPAQLWLEVVRRLQHDQQDRIAHELFEYFKHQDFAQRKDAAETIALIDPGPLIRALESREALIQIAALEMVGGTELKEAVPYIAKILDSRSGPEVRVVAYGALGEISTEEAATLLEKGVHDAEATVCLAAIRALGRLTMKFDPAISVVHSALVSLDSDKKEAARYAIATSRSPLLIQSLVQDKSITGKSRDEIWATIRSFPQLWHWIESIIPQLDLPDLKQVRMIHVFRKKCLEVMAKRTDAEGGSARKDLQQIQATELTTRTKEQQATVQLTGNLPLDEIARIIADERLSAWAVAERISQFGNSGPLLLQMLGNHKAQIRICAWIAIGWKQARVEIPDRTYRTSLADLDSGVRYFTCYAAAINKRTTLVDVIAGLAYDQSRAEPYFWDIGQAVGGMANWALDQLAPYSKVWRKPFHRLVKSGVTGDTTGQSEQSGDT